MGRWPRTITLFCLAALIAYAFQGSKKKKSTPVTRITIEARAASAAKVEQYLQDSAGTALVRPGALVPVLEQLARLSAGQDPKTVHIMHFGDSHTAADEWTGDLRDLFKAKFGDGGSGFSVAGRPFPGYRRFDAHGGASTLCPSADTPGRATATSGSAASASYPLIAASPYTSTPSATASKSITCSSPGVDP